MRGILLYLLVIAVVLESVVEGQRWNSQTNSRHSGKGGYGYNASSEHAPSGKPQESKTIAGGIGAWGYIAICLTIILSGISVYYFVVFYPIVCKKERMYDVMEMTTV